MTESTREQVAFLRVATISEIASLALSVRRSLSTSLASRFVNQYVFRIEQSRLPYHILLLWPRLLPTKAVECPCPWGKGDVDMRDVHVGDLSAKYLHDNHRRSNFLKCDIRNFRVDEQCMGLSILRRYNPSYDIL